MFRGWKVGSNKFTNFWNAVDSSKQQNCHIEFDYHNDVFCNLQGLKVDQEFDYRSEYLKKLFTKQQNLLYSGGSDSHTILKLSEDLNLKWQNIFTVISAPTKDGEANWEYQPGIKYCQTKNYPLTVINQDIDYYEKLNQDPNFMYKNGGEINFRPDYFQFSNEYNQSENFICGHEKPFLIYYKSRWYTWMQDVMLQDYIDCTNICYFFISPEMPEIYIQDARQSRNYYVKNHGLPLDGTIVSQRPDRSSLPNDRTLKHRFMIHNHKNVSAVKQLWEMGRIDVIHNWLDITKSHYEKYKNDIAWENRYEYKSLLCWLIDIDSLESIDTTCFSEMLTV